MSDVRRHPTAKSVVAAAIMAIGLSFVFNSTAVAQQVFAGDLVDGASGLPYPILPGLPLLLPGPDEEFGTADDVIDTGVTGDTDLAVRIGTVTGGSVPPPSGAPGGAAVQTIIAGGGSLGVGAEVDFSVLVSDGSGAPPYGNVITSGDLDGRPLAIYAFADLDGDGFVGPTDADGSTDDALERQEATAYVGRQVGSLLAGRHSGSLGVHLAAPASMGGLSVVISAGAYTGTDAGAQFSDGTPIHTLWPYFPPLDPSRVIGNGNSPAPDPTVPSELKFEPERNYLPAPGHPLLGTPFAIATDGSEATVDHVVVFSGEAHGARFFDELTDADFRSISRVRLRPAPRNGGGRVLVQPVENLAIDADGATSTRALRLLPVDLFGNVADPTGGGLSVQLSTVGSIGIVSPDSDGDSKVETVVLADAAGAVIVLDDSGAAGIARIDLVSSARALGTLPVVVGPSTIDEDADGVVEDGNGSGIRADFPCSEDDVAAGIACDDNCTAMLNPSQIDGDQNGLGDCCDGACALQPGEPGCVECASVVPPVPSSILEKVKIRLKTPGNGKPDRLKVRARFTLDSSASIDPTTEDVALVLAQSGGVAYGAVLSGAYEQKFSPSKYRYRDSAGIIGGVERSDISSRDGSAFKFKWNAAGPSLASLAEEPAGLDVTIGDDVFSVVHECVAKSRSVICK